VPYVNENITDMKKFNLRHMIIEGRFLIKGNNLPLAGLGTQDIVLLALFSKSV